MYDVVERSQVQRFHRRFNLLESSRTFATLIYLRWSTLEYV